MSAVEERKRALIHERVGAAMALGLPRSEAFYAVAEALDLRAGHVAATYWRVERSRLGVPDTAGQQMTLGGSS